jgi:hypothetical protein
MTAEVTRRWILFISAALILAAVIFDSSNPRPAISDTLPSRLTDVEFWQMVTDFSEPGGYFRSENFLSNETGYQNVIPALRKTLLRGGVYLGVGPEQNFTYIVALEPKIAFVVDIRRQNMLEQLFYKALIETSADRTEFLSRLFSRTAPARLARNPTPEALFRAYESGEGSPTLLEMNVSRMVEYLEKQKGFKLSGEDETGVRHVAQAFFDSGPDLSYTFIGGYGGFMNMPTYSDLMTESDGVSHNWNFLATDDQFRTIQRLQKNNLIVPLVGDFAGTKTIRAVARYTQQHGGTVRAFYTSNVEQYLFQDDQNWKRFYENAGALPLDSSSTFIRYVLNGYGFRRQPRSLTSSIDDTVRAYRSGRIRGYYDVINLSR